jgi:mycothiol synthase
MNALPQGYSMQPIALDDVPRLARFVNAYARRFTGRDVMSEDRLRTQLTTPGLDLATSAQRIRDPSGEPIAAGIVFHRDPHVAVHAWGFVDETHLGVGIGRCLHGWILERARTAVGMAPDDARVVLLQNTFDGDAAANAFLEAAGYTQTRHYWRMSIDLDTDDPPSPVWPAGIVVCTFDPESDLEAGVRATRDAFRDHYGFVAGSIEGDIDRTRHWIEGDPDVDPSLWFLARDGDEIAGLCLCAPSAAGEPHVGYVQTLGVRPPWRRRGLGRALLLHAFGEFRRRGADGVALHVDSQSLTGATRLYESVGMRVDELSHAYELELRPGVDLTAKATPG